MPGFRKASLIINCGYARVCIFQNSNPKGTVGRNARQNIDIAQRSDTFKARFSRYPHYGIPNDYFIPTGKDQRSPFDRDSAKILDGFQSKFRNEIGYSRESYLQEFSLMKWSNLTSSEKQQHTMSNCMRCFQLAKDHQHYFPLKPVYEPQPVIAVNKDALQHQGIKAFTSNVCSELNSVYSDEAGSSFADSLVQVKSLQLEHKKTKAEKKKEKKHMQKVVTKKISECFSENAALTMLTEGESKRMYHRKRLAQSFCSPEAPSTAKKKKSHSPNFSNVSWDTDRLLSTLQNWPRGATINWTMVAKDHGISGGNAGQVAKEFAIAQEVDLTQMVSSTPNRKPTKRPCKRKLPGYDVSIPSNPSLRSVEAEIQDMIASGHFTLGEECAPYTITKYILENGKLVPKDTLVYARKVPLQQIRQRLISKHQPYMRLTPLSTVTSMTEEELREVLQKANVPNLGSMSHPQLCELLIRYQRSRSLCIWHDHATILKMGFIMLTVHIMYDPLVFFTDEEYQQVHPHATVSVQCEVEQPEVYLLSLGSSSAEDQASLIGDRISCLLDLQTPVKTEQGIEITDNVRFFTGDHPAAQFEQGTKQGGTYKCGACGCKEYLFSDQAHTLCHDWRQLKELQSLATGGTFGRNAGVLRPFHNLRVGELKRELRARSVHIDEKMLKANLQEEMDNILRGVVRVPALLLTNPTQPLESLGLERYEVVASEPMHDLKGHILNLIVELPQALPPSAMASCTHLIDCCLAKEKKSAADLRRVAIQLYLLLKDQDCSSRVILLLQTIIKIGEILYSHDKHRSPRQLLQLHNCCWLHLELCKDVFSDPTKLTTSRMFGHYLHALTAHCPTQYELACLRSLNTENQERLFGQARTIGESCTNHHPDNIIPQILLRLQAKQDRHIAMAAVRNGDSQVAHVAKDLPPLPGTTIKSSYIQQREDSWQNHLQHVSPFLTAVEGVWWTSTSGGFHFHDGDGDSTTQDDSFTLLHFRQNSIQDVENRWKRCWKKILADKIVIPAREIKVYDQYGMSTGRLQYSGETVTFIPLPGETDGVLSSIPSSTEGGTVPFNGSGSSAEGGPVAFDGSGSGTEVAFHGSGSGTEGGPITFDGSGSGTGSDTEESPVIFDGSGSGTESGPVNLGHDTSARSSNSISSTHSTPSDSATCTTLFSDTCVPWNAPIPWSANNQQSQRWAQTHRNEPDLPQTCDNATKLGSALCLQSSLEEHSNGLTTMLANSIKKLLPTVDMISLTEFDTLRSKLKKGAQTKPMEDRYKTLTTIMVTKVAVKKKELDKIIEDMERKHYQQYRKLPSKTQNSLYRDLLKEKKLATAILRNIGIYP